MIEKTYNASELEGRIYASWEAAGAFRAGRPERRDAAPYSIVIPPPNVTGSLHMGHALNNTLQDVLVRFERMRGRDVLWQPGTDHAGIATQMVVERQLMERQEPGRRAMGREAFIKRVWEWKEESGGTIIRQLKRLGASCDWSRERFTMDEGLSRAVLKVFVELYKAGLIYKDKRLVNWDPKLRTAISDLEVQQVEVKGHLWYIKYPIEGLENTYITVATTRPETMLGDVAVAVHPDDERYKHLVGRHAILPLVRRPIPIIADEYSDPQKGTGAVKVTPAHDFNDFEVGKRHDLRMINILTPEAKMLLRPNFDFTRDVPWTPEIEQTIAELNGLDRFEARKRIVARMEAKGLVEKIEPHVHTVPHGDRSGAVIEPFLTDQWYVDAKTLAREAIRAVRDGRTVFVPKQWETTYFNWMENIQPWCISRQLWWGHQIPAWYGPTKNQFGYDYANWFPFVAQSEAELLAQASKHYGMPAHIEKSEQAAAEYGLSHTKNLDSIPLWRDEDVLDTWFSSALWPFSTLGWPEQTPELKRYYPTSVLVTGFDIIFFWVARMMMMSLYFMKEVPFRTVYIHALVRDERGQKMSKSKGNIIDPLGLIDEYGADALRFTLAAMATQGRDIRLSRQRVEGYRNFATKLWNAARFCEINGCTRAPRFDPRRVKETLNSWILHETINAAKKVTVSLEAYKFNEAAEAIYQFVWSLYCDWYLELIKPALTGPDGVAKNETRATAAWVLDEILKLLHPFMPFLTEELWQLTAPREAMLILTEWPIILDPYRSEGLFKKGARRLIQRAERIYRLISGNNPAESEIGFLIGLIETIRSARTEFDIPPSSVSLVRAINYSHPNRRLIVKYRNEITRLSRSYVDPFVSPLVTSDDPDVPEETILAARAQLTLEHVVLPYKEGQLLLHGIDATRQRVKYERELSKLDTELSRVNAKLSNADFAARAPEEVVEAEREKREEAESRRAKILEALERLEGAA